MCEAEAWSWDAQQPLHAEPRKTCAFAKCWFRLQGAAAAEPAPAQEAAADLGNAVPSTDAAPAAAGNGSAPALAGATPAGNEAAEAAPDSATPVQDSMRRKLQQALQPNRCQLCLAGTRCLN